MKAYIIKPFERRPGTTVRMGLPEVTITLDDEINPVEYVKNEHREWLVNPMCVELFDETREHLLWESHPR
jgi:hypothetical protein